MEPNEENLSFFTVYMCHHINPRSVINYLLWDLYATFSPCFVTHSTAIIQTKADPKKKGEVEVGEKNLAVTEARMPVTRTWKPL